MERTVFQRSVATAVAKKAGISLTTALALVEQTQVGALKAGDLRYLVYKGPEYWAEKIIECG